MPLLYFIYILFSLFLFYFGPLSYPMVNVEVTLLYIILCYGSLFSGLLFGNKFISTTVKVNSRNNLNSLFIVFSIISILFASYIISSLSKGGITDSLLTGMFRSGDAYYSNLNLKKESSLITQFMTLLSPLTILSLTLGVVLFKYFSFYLKLLFFILIFVNLMSYIVKGTNFGVFLTFTPLIIASILHYKSKSFFSKKLILSLMLFIFFLLYFVSAMATRLNIDYIPNSLSGIDVNKDFFLFSIFPNSLAVAITVASSYISQGYYGLSLAFSYPYTTTSGFGSGGFIIDKFGKFVDPDLWFYTYQAKMDHVWDSSVQWHTAFLWLANDVSLFGVFLLMFLFGIFAAVIYKDAKIENSILSKALFSIISIILIFLPANNILGGNPFIFTSFFSLSLVWFLTRRVYIK